MGEPVEHVRGGEDGQRVRDEPCRLVGRPEQQRHLIPQQVHGRQPQHAQADGDQVVRVAEAAHAVGVARAVVLGDERLRAVAHALDEHLDDAGGVRHHCVGRQRLLAAVHRQVHVDGHHRDLGQKGQPERRQPQPQRMQRDMPVGTQVGHGDAVLPFQEKAQHQQKRRNLRDHGGRRRTGGAHAQQDDEHVVKRHVHQAGEHLHGHRVGHFPLVADKRRAAGHEDLERDAPGDDARVRRRLRQRLALAS